MTPVKITLEIYITPDGRQWVSLPHLIKGLGVKRQIVIKWLQQHPHETRKVRLGVRAKVETSVYSLRLVFDFIRFHYSGATDSITPQCTKERTEQLIRLTVLSR